MGERIKGLTVPEHKDNHGKSQTQKAIFEGRMIRIDIDRMTR